MSKSIIKLNSAIISAGSVVGKKEHEGPIGKLFDMHDMEDRFGQKTWEQAEAEMQRLAANAALAKCGLDENSIDVMFAGDLINQCTSSAYGLLEYNVPFMGLYGACSTAIEGLILSSVMTSFGVYKRCLSVTSSHNCSAERQFRTPLEYGAQRAPTAQWTVTGAGAFVTENADSENAAGKARIVEAMPGISVEKGIKDAGNMGAAMAPAALSTLMRYFNESGKNPSDFDLIVTGDLGYEGISILGELLMAEGIDAKEKLNDCGMMIFSRKTQDTHSGGSGCGCSAVVLASYLLPKLESGELQDILIMGTGALMSPDSIKQGLGIPGIAHLIHITAGGKS
ncbi:MAG: stage V sporulation protein AD [Clostridia bacterium]|nr:stage V sporulation protein AD [Clostridia bacterium]